MASRFTGPVAPAAEPRKSRFSGPATQQRSAPNPAQLAEAEKLRNPGREEVVVGGRGFTQPGKFHSFVDGAYDYLTAGFGDELSAGVESALTEKTYDEALDKNREASKHLAANNPGSHLAGQVVGGVIPAVATLGAATPMTVGKTLATGVGYGALQGGAYEAGSAEGDITDRLKAIPEGVAIGGALGTIPGVGTVVWRGGKALIAKTVNGVQKFSSPSTAAERQLVKDMVEDRISHETLVAKENAAGHGAPQKRYLDTEDVIEADAMGQRPMVSDLGGDSTRVTLKAAANRSTKASDTLVGASAARQSRQGDRITDTVQSMYEDGGLDPGTITDRLRKRAAEINDQNYKLAENDPKAAHLFDDGGPLQRAISSDFGQRALKKAITRSKDEALAAGEDVLEPTFKVNEKGLMEFTGIKTPQGEDITGVGMSLKVWNNIKKSMDDEISAAFRGGFNEDAKSMRAIRDRMVTAIDAEVPSYKTARAEAKETFDLIGKRGGDGGALNAGAHYFNNMNSFDISDARKAMGAMSPPERELFARGYAGELITKVSKMGNAEDVNKLFKSPQSRLKMRDALGDKNADLLEAFTHREMVQKSLGQHIGANSTTMKQAIADETFKSGAAAGTGYYYGGGEGMMIGLALRGGFKFADRAIVTRYAKAMADLAVSDDPDTIQRILTKVSRDPKYMAFSRSVANGLSSKAGPSGGNAARNPSVRQEPRLFAGGGRVGAIAGALEYLEGAIKQTSKATGKGTDFSDVPHVFDLSNLDAVPDVEQRMLQRYAPKHGPSDRAQRLVKNKKARDGVSAAMESGVRMGAKGWYNNDPLRDAFVGQLGEDEGSVAFRQLMDYVAASSPRSKVDVNARNASYYYMKARQNAMPKVGDKNPKPYGHLAQRLHQMNANRVNETGQWDELRNPKPASFAANLSGNQTPGTIDTHALRLPAISTGDPEWLAKQLVVQGPNKEKLTLNPRKMFLSGDLKRKDFMDRPAMWESQPNDNEYPIIEKMYQELAGEQGLTTAQGQAAAWAGGGDLTGLGSVGADPFVKVFEDRIRLTAKSIGMPPEEVLRRVIAGEMALMKDGGRVRRSA